MQNLFKKTILVMVAFGVLVTSSQACTRAICVEGDRVITTRSMDWETNIPTSLWIFPKGMERNGGGDNPITWKSEYGSIVAVGFNSVTGDGMNEKGLVANLLWINEADYGKSDKPTLSIGAFAQFVLDNYENVAEAVKYLKGNPFQIFSRNLPGDDEEQYAAMHLTISDPSGDSAIIEFVKGNMVIFHSKEYKVATNSPSFEQQLSINDYWKTVGGSAMLPGTSRSTDRFVRASFYTNNPSKDKIYKKDRRMAVAKAFSIIRNASVPLGVKIPYEDDTPYTLWRTVSDQKALGYYFDAVVSPSVFWVDINKLDLSKKGKVKTLDLSTYPSYSGEVSSKFVDSEPFEWLK